MNKKIKTIVELSVLAALTIVLQFFSPKIGAITLNLSLTPILVAALLYGPGIGAIMGAISGLVAFFLPDTQGLFWTWGIPQTFVICLVKTAAAGAVSGLIFKAFKKRQVLGTVLASMSAPVVNTGLFTLGCVAFFIPHIVEMADANGMTPLTFYMVGFIGVNFIVEFFLNTVLATAIHRIYVALENR